jgi:hypothetical protein
VGTGGLGDGARHWRAKGPKGIAGKLDSNVRGSVDTNVIVKVQVLGTRLSTSLGNCRPSSATQAGACDCDLRWPARWLNDPEKKEQCGDVVRCRCAARRCCSMPSLDNLKRKLQAKGRFSRSSALYFGPTDLL